MTPATQSRPHRQSPGRRRPGCRFRAGLILPAMALVAANLPYLAGLARCPEGHRFWAVPLINSGDANQYLAFARMARDGAWLMGDPFTLQPYEPRLFLPLSLLEGWLAALLGMDPLWVWQASRIAGGVLLLAAAWWFGGLFLRATPTRFLYGLLLGFSGGLGFVLDLTHTVPTGDHLQPEGNTLFTLGNLAHLPATQAAMIILIGSLLTLRSRIRGGPLLAVAAASAFLSWEHPFDLIPVALATGLFNALDFFKERRLSPGAVAHVVAVAAGAAPAALYYLWLIAGDEFYRMLAHDSLRRREPLFYLAAHGPLLLAAAFAAARPVLRRRLLLPACWVGGVFLLLALPLDLGGKQVRSLSGVHVPLSLLAAAGLDLLLRGGRAGSQTPGAVRAARTLGLALLLVLLSGGWGIFARHWRAYQPGTFFYQPRSVVRLLEELGRRSRPGDAALGGPLTGGWMPSWAPVRSYEGHWHMTPNRRARQRERTAFYAGLEPPERREQWLADNGIEWVLWWPGEWRLPARAPADLAALEIVWSGDGAMLFRTRKIPSRPAGRSETGSDMRRGDEP